MTEILTLLFLTGSTALIGFIIGLKMRRAEKSEKVPQYVSENDIVREHLHTIDELFSKAIRENSKPDEISIRLLKNRYIKVEKELSDIKKKLEEKASFVFTISDFRCLEIIRFLRPDIENLLINLSEESLKSLREILK